MLVIAQNSFPASTIQRSPFIVIVDTPGKEVTASVSGSPQKIPGAQAAFRSRPSHHRLAALSAAMASGRAADRSVLIRKFNLWHSFTTSAGVTAFVSILLGFSVPLIL